jgi:hypothetical protein
MQAMSANERAIAPAGGPAGSGSQATRGSLDVARALDQMLDEALEATFPASDPVATFVFR